MKTFALNFSMIFTPFLCVNPCSSLFSPDVDNFFLIESQILFHLHLKFHVTDWGGLEQLC